MRSRPGSERTCTAACTSLPEKRCRPTRPPEGLLPAISAAASPREVVFTYGATSAINLVAHSFGGLLNPGDEVVISELEHHSNIVPWQMLVERAGHHRKSRQSDARRPARSWSPERHRDETLPIDLGDALLECDRRGHGHDRRCRRRQSGGREGAARRCSARGAWTGRRSGAGRRFLRLLRTQDVRPDRHRRAVGA